MEYQTTGRSMQRNHGSALPRYVIAVDCETFPTRDNCNSESYSHTFRLGVAICGRYQRGTMGSVSRHHFQEPGDFWELLQEKTGPRHTVWVIAHNAVFDLVTLGLTTEVSSGRYSLDMPRAKRAKATDNTDENTSPALCCLAAPPFILGLQCTATKGRVVFVDSLNWFRSTLREIGESIGLEKLAMPQFIESNDIWAEYCERDTEITFQCFSKLITWERANDFGVFRYTAAAQAMGAYRHRFAPCRIDYHDNAEVKALERESFAGGRTDVFKCGKIDEDIYQLDVNSLYPSVMRNNLYPRRLNVYSLDPKPKPLPNIGDWSRCVAEVDLENAPPIYPLRSDDITIYPAGSFRTVLCGPELWNAVYFGHAKTVGRWAKYKLAPLFTKWVDELWAMRSEYKKSGNIAYAAFCKMLLNSLFGKFAQRPIKWIECENRIDGLDWSQWAELDWETKKPIMYRSIGGKVFQENQETERPDTLVAISAFVASYGRVAMNTFRGIAGQRNVFYQGVDGLLVSRQGYYNLQNKNCCSESELGKLRTICQSNAAHIYNAADYSIGKKQVIAGRSQTVATKELDKIFQRRFDGVAALFTGNKTPVIHERIVQWRRKSEYRKGQKTESGWIEPFII